ncbi:NAD(P)H-quinone oxidoreductase [Hugenholtzia roseola]|uniref:NAD(P)H-quinone oxidoreductase n=1 Tax=Hugenholtzia roseola TaxID=1002 RepID=UPI0004121486|nr:NAD(P)H-quinone oxidoreductase [Hugenholtzia roseola]
MFFIQHTNETLSFQEMASPEINSQEVLIEVRAAGINRADLLQRAGKYPPPQGASHILGLEVSGIIKAKGEAVANWQVGDKVMALLSGGGYAQQAKAHQNLLMPLPEGFSFEQGAALPEAFLTAYQALFLVGKACPQERVLIHAGASGVGTAAIQLAKVFDLEVVTTCSTAKMATCRNLGADLVIDYTNENFYQKIQTFYPSSKEAGIDLIIDCIGASYWTDNLKSLRLDGRLVLLAALSGVKIDNFNIATLLTKRLQILGTTLRNRSLSYQSDLIFQFWKNTKNLWAEGKLMPIIDSVFEWQQAEEAHKRMQANLNMGKIVLKVS